jgi:hypothetical protein
MRDNLIVLNARPLQETDDLRAPYRRDGSVVYRAPGWKAVCVRMGVSILLWCGLIRSIFELHAHCNRYATKTQSRLIRS